MTQIHIDTEGRKPVGKLPPEQQEKIRAAVERFLRRLEAEAFGIGASKPGEER